jgi:hypothetical protein
MIASRFSDHQNLTAKSARDRLGQPDRYVDVAPCRMARRTRRRGRAGVDFFLQTAGSKDKTLKLYPGAFHDLLNDLGREAVAADIIEWIETRLAANTAPELQPFATQKHRSSFAKE